MLHVNEVIRYGASLYRVDYVNECRARIVPLAKRHVILADGREFDAERGGVNISANSDVVMVDDPERALAAIELAAAEAELVAAQRALALEHQPVTVASTAPVRAPSVKGGMSGAKIGGWRAGPKPAPTFRDGSLAATVMAYLVAHPGLSTKALVEAINVEGNVAACLSRFHQQGIIQT